MDEFVGKDEAFVKDWQGLEKPVNMILKICFLNFRYFFISSKHINISDMMNYISFITVKTITDENTTWTAILHSQLA